MILDTTNLNELKSKLENTEEFKTAASCEANCYGRANCSCSPTWFGYEAFAKAWQQLTVGWFPG